jgi:hypothetical protein
MNKFEKILITQITDWLLSFASFIIDIVDYLLSLLAKPSLSIERHVYHIQSNKRLWK